MLFATELIQGRVMPSVEHTETEVLGWISFYNRERLHQELGYLSPVAFEAAFACLQPIKEPVRV